MLKRFIVMMLCLVLVSVVFIVPLAADERPAITVEINGEEVEFDVQPQTISGRTMVPMRRIFEALGAYVEWDDATQTITAVRDETTVIMQINNYVMRIDDEEVTLDVSPQLINGRTLVPARAIAEGLGMDVDWDEVMRTVIIASLQTEVQDLEEVWTPVGIAYADPMFRMTVVINNIEWRFHRERNPDQVFFFNYINPSADNIISISAFPFSGDASQEISRLWGEMRANHERTPMEVSIIYHDMQSIQVGVGQHSGYLHSFEIIIDETVFVSNAIFWAAGGMMYICTTSATEYNSEEVQGVLEGILESFESLTAF